MSWMNYEPEESEPEIKSANKIKEEVNFNAEYTKMELHHQGTMQQRSMNHKVAERTEHVNQT